MTGCRINGEFILKCLDINVPSNLESSFSSRALGALTDVGH